MSADKQSLVSAGFDPSALDQIVRDFANDAPLVLSLMADLKSMGFGIAWIVDCVNTAGKAGVQLLQDLTAMFKTPTTAVRSAMMHPAMALMKSPPGSHPFLDWLVANASTFSPLLLKLLLSLLAKKPA